MEFKIFGFQVMIEKLDKCSVCDNVEDLIAISHGANECDECGNFTCEKCQVWDEGRCYCSICHHRLTEETP